MVTNKMVANMLMGMLIPILVLSIVLSVQSSEANPSVKLALNSIAIGALIAALILFINFFHTEALLDDILKAINGKENST